MLWQPEAPGEIDDGNNLSLDIDHTEHNLRSVRYRGDLNYMNDACRGGERHNISLLVQGKNHELMCAIHRPSAPERP